MQTANSSTMPSKLALIGLGLILAIGGCDRPEVTGPETQVAERAGPAAVSSANLVQVIAQHDAAGDYEFVLQRPTGDAVTQIPSGWTTFELDNHSGATHFVYTAKVPEAAIQGAAEDGVPVLDYWYEHLTRPFQWYMDFLDPDKDPDPADLSEKYTTADDIFPDWFLGAVPMGGPGFTQGYETSRTTVKLDPGFYVVECYVKDGDGLFHSYRGMLTLLEVTEDVSRTPEPRPTMAVDLLTGQIEAPQEVRPGLHTVAVHWEEQTTYSHLLGHDVHLLRLDGGWTVEDAAAWMDWSDPDGLVSASGARGPATFVGGAQTAPEGSTAYFTVRLEPGEYAWIAEVPGNVGMWQTFTVPFGNPAPGR